MLPVFLSIGSQVPTSFWNAFLDLLFSDSGLDQHYRYRLIVFAAGSAFMGFLAVLLDILVYSVRGRSIFQLGWGGSILKSARLVLLWGLGAGLGGFLGSEAGIVTVTRLACIGVGVGWPLILPRLIDSFTRDMDRQKTEEQHHGH